MQHQQENGDKAYKLCSVSLRNIQAHAIHGNVLVNLPKLYRGKVFRYGSICTAILHVCELIVAENEPTVLGSQGGCPSEDCVID